MLPVPRDLTEASRFTMAKLKGRFWHINKGQFIEGGREVEFRIETMSSDFCTIQMQVSQISLVLNFLDKFVDQG